MHTSMHILITCSRLVEFAGAEITTIELIEEFLKLDWSVSVGSFEFSEAFKDILVQKGTSIFDLSQSGAFPENSIFDLIWLHHSVTAYRVLLDSSISSSQVIFSSLSHFEPIEAPPLSTLKVSKYLVNSEENLSHFVRKYPELKNRVTVFPNSAPRTFWASSKVSSDAKLRQLAVVSNHIPNEVLSVIELLRQQNIRVDIFGLSDRSERITPEVLQNYDAVVSIGKTVQYCIAMKIPVYCYDHFGGDGWLTRELFDNSRFYNFSGRCSRGKIDQNTLYLELTEGYQNALNQIHDLHELGLQYFQLNLNVNSVLSSTMTKFTSFDLNETDRSILRLQSDFFQRQRQIIANIGVLNADSKKFADEATRKVSELDKELFRIKSSLSYRSLSPFRSLLRRLKKLNTAAWIHLSWIHFLLIRSVSVIKHQGWSVFFNRSLRYMNGLVRRAFASFRLKEQPLLNFGKGTDDSRDGILVSFVIPVYDRTDVLRESIRSALSQTVANLEVIVVTDGSPPETLKVVSEFASDPRMRIFNFPKSSGNAVRGRNKGIIESRGKYIAFLDSDDIAVPSRLEMTLPLLENNQADVVYGAWQAIVDGSRDNTTIADGQIVLSPNADLKMLLETSVPCQSTVTVRKQLLAAAGYLKPTMKYREDHELWARLAYHGGMFRSLPQVLTKLRLHSGNNELNFLDNDNHWYGKVQSEYKLVGPKPKKIAFILPGVGISGGIAVVFKHAEMLMNAGHDAFVINVGEMGTGDWYSNNPVPIVHVSDNRTYLFNRINLLIATGWSTVEWINRISADRKLYFVQSDERRFFIEPSLQRKIHQTYLTSCEYFTEAFWIQRMLQNEFGHSAKYVPNGLDSKIFYPDNPLMPRTPGKIRILLEGPIIVPFKGMADSYAAIEGLDCEVWIVSSAGKPPAHWKYDRFFESVPFGEMRKIYSACDIFLKMSRIEGFFGPPMEAMACGCSVVVGKVTGYDEYIVHEHNALVVEQGDILGAKMAVTRLISDNTLRNSLIQAGFQTVKNWSWERSAKAMLEVVDNDFSDRTSR